MLVYLGRHHYDSRVRKDGYLPCDLVHQLEAALASTSVIETHRHMTAVVSASDRDDGHGNKVRDRAILELQARKPRAEVYFVVAKGDFIRPKKQQSPGSGLWLVHTSPDNRKGRRQGHGQSVPG